MPQNGFQIGPLQPSTAGLKPLSPEEQSLMDRYNESQQALDPTWKKVIRGGVGGIAGATSSLFGQNFEPGAPSAFDKGNAVGQLLQAGLPFAAYAGKLMKGESELPQIYHGTQKVFENFDPSKYDTSDVLGWMTHFSENPSYASAEYAGGGSKGIKKVSFNPAYGPVEEGELTAQEYPFHPTLKKTNVAKPRMIPARPKAQNVLDLVDPNPDDLSAALAAHGPDERKRLLAEFKAAKAHVRESPEDAHRLLRENHYGSVDRIDVPKNEIPARYLADRLRMTPEEFDKTLFDAIRYRDNSEKSWAIPERTPIETPWGTPLNKTPKELKVFKHYQDTGSTAKTTTNFRTASKPRPKSFWQQYSPNSPVAAPAGMKYKNLDPGELNSAESIKPMASHSLLPTGPEANIPLESWALKTIEANPTITNQEIQSMFLNGYLTSPEKVALKIALGKK